MEWKFNANDLDAIRITAPNGDFDIVGTDDTEVIVEGEGSSRRYSNREPLVNERWLALAPIGGGDWALRLPKHKSWNIEITSGSGDVNIENVTARIRAQLGSGEIQVQDARGVFNLRSGSGDVVLERCVEVDVPAAPAWKQTPPSAPGFVPPAPGSVPPVPPMPPSGGMPPIPPIDIKFNKRRIRIDPNDDWEEYGRQWEEWGERFAEQASHWAEQFAQYFGDSFMSEDDETKAAGIHVRLGHGDVQLQELEASNVTVRLGSGDIQLEDGRVQDLTLQTEQGDVNAEAVLPTGEWELVTRHGDIALELTADAFVRIDAATRHGDIECDAPLVRVGRPGPGARHGGRMVGTVGQGANEPVDVHLECQHGDIQISLSRQSSRYAGAPAQPAATAARAASPAAVQTVPTPQPPATAPSAVVPVTVTDLPPTGSDPALNAPPKKGMQVYDSQLAILHALQSGEITIAEAEMLLRSLPA